MLNSACLLLLTFSPWRLQTRALAHLWWVLKAHDERNALEVMAMQEETILHKYTERRPRTRKQLRESAHAFHLRPPSLMDYGRAP